MPKFVWRRIPAWVRKHIPQKVSGIGGALMFFPDSREITLLKIKASMMEEISRTNAIVYPVSLGVSGQWGAQLSAGVSFEKAWWLGNGNHNSKDFEGYFWTFSANIAGFSLGSYHDTAGKWVGGNVGYKSGVGKGGSYVGWKYSIDRTWKIPEVWWGDCLIFSLIASSSFPEYATSTAQRAFGHMLWKRKRGEVKKKYGWVGNYPVLGGHNDPSTLREELLSASSLPYVASDVHRRR